MNVLYFTLFYYFQIIIINIDTHDISGYTIRTQYLRNLQISEAEMTQYLCNIKISSTNCLTKKYRVLYFPYVLRDKIVLKIYEQTSIILINKYDSIYQVKCHTMFLQFLITESQLLLLFTLFTYTLFSYIVVYIEREMDRSICT